MKITTIPTFRADADGRVLQFFALSKSAWRVVINGRGVDWMEKPFRPSAKTAQFFLEKHGRA